MTREQNLNRRYGRATVENSSNATRPVSKPYILVAISATVCYLNSLFGEFVYDDFEVFETNADVRPSTPISNLLTNDFWGIPLERNDSHKSYRPITVLTFRWNFLAGGLDPTGYHVINVALHGTVSALFFHICTRILGDYGNFQTGSLPLLCGMFFALQPIHTEAVANVVGRAEILCAYFYLLALLSYINCFPDGTTNASSKRPAKYSRLWLVSCIFWCVLSLFSKEQGITALAVCIAYDFIFVCKIKGEHLFKVCSSPTVLLSYRQWPKWAVRLVERLSILALASVILLYLRIVIISRGFVLSFTKSDNPTLFHPDVWTRFRTYSYLCALNARLLLCPSSLCYDWSMDSISRIESWWDMRNVQTLVFSGILVCLCCYGLKSSSMSTPSHETTGKSKKSYSKTLDSNENDIRFKDNFKYVKSQHCGLKMEEFESLQRRRIVMFSLALMIIPFLPASNLFLPVGFVIAERILYIPSMGLCILVPFGISILFGKQTKVEEDSSTHESPNKIRFHETSPSSWSFSLSATGTVLTYSLLLLFAAKTVHRNSEWLNKEELARSGLKVNPTNAKIHVMLGNVLAKKGLMACERYYREALRLRPHYVAAWENLGLVLLNTGRAQEAEKCYLKALSIKPNSADGNINLAHLLRVTSRWKEAHEQYVKALSLRPNNPQLHYFHGVVLEKLGKRKFREQRRNTLRQQN
ncbi:transmembrane and TPR repeat-containing protein 2-like isoform X2 [Stylophora pistillata]|uniref:transmembrane and TPR repeat-containing protein 2-like isoform X2 n=1 Tax=Stylophora pistillata TaxID=50429 RepID=UPI000C050984|nr:transmembrane and TPR repeat-containing protein 2-like isoform X2 [Stylophora pistillata]